MDNTWHDPTTLLAVGVPVGLAWSGLLIGAFKLLLDRYLAELDEQLNFIPRHAQKLTELEQCLNNRTQCLFHAEFALSIKALHKRLDEQHRVMDEQMKVVGRVDGRLEGIGRAVDLMNQFLIEQGGKR